MQLKQMPKLADRLIYIRKIYNLSQTELAQMAGTTQQAIQQAEKGKARQPRYLHRLAQQLEISVEWVIFGEANDESPIKKQLFSSGFQEDANEVVENFFAMPKKDQKLILELMKSRQEK